MRRCAEVKSKFAFFQEQWERFAIDSVVFAQDAFCLIPKILNAVNVVLTVCKFLGMVDTVMDKTAYVQLVIAAQAIRVNNAVRHDFLFDNRHQSIRLGIIYDNGIDPSVCSFGSKTKASRTPRPNTKTATYSNAASPSPKPHTQGGKTLARISIPIWQGVSSGKSRRQADDGCLRIKDIVD